MYKATHTNIGGSLLKIDQESFELMGMFEDVGFDIEITSMKHSGNLSRYVINGRVDSGVAYDDIDAWHSSFNVELIIYYKIDEPYIHICNVCDSNSGELVLAIQKPDDGMFIHEIYTAMKSQFMD